MQTHTTNTKDDEPRDNLAGYAKCPEWLKQAYRRACKFRCQNCRNAEQAEGDGKLTIHRIIRGCKGGLYVPNNIKVICFKCHRALHAGEFK